jgi:hypothetical protein
LLFKNRIARNEKILNLKPKEDGRINVDCHVMIEQNIEKEFMVFLTLITLWNISGILSAHLHMFANKYDRY